MATLPKFCLSYLNRLYSTSGSYVRSFSYDEFRYMEFGAGSSVLLSIPGTYLLDDSTNFLVGVVNGTCPHPLGWAELGVNLYVNASGQSTMLASMGISRYINYSEDFNVMGVLDFRNGRPSHLSGGLSAYNLTVRFGQGYGGVSRISYYSVSIFELTSK